MTWMVRTGINIAVMFRQMVDVVEEIALVISQSVCLSEANVQQHTAIKTAGRRLNTRAVQNKIATVYGITLRAIEH